MYVPLHSKYVLCAPSLTNPYTPPTTHPQAKVTLVLGPPSAGKTSYLRTLSGRITTYPTPRTVVNGEITYNGRTFDEFVVKKTAAYVDEVWGC